MSFLSHSSIQEPRSISVLSIPYDVLAHHVFSQLGIASLVSCSLTCVTLQRMIKRTFSSKFSKQQVRGAAIIDDTFLCGSPSLLSWLQQALLYPNFSNTEPTLLMRHRRNVLLLRCLQMAAKGTSRLYSRKELFRDYLVSFSLFLSAYFSNLNQWYVHIIYLYYKIILFHTDHYFFHKNKL